MSKYPLVISVFMAALLGACDGLHSDEEGNEDFYAGSAEGKSVSLPPEPCHPGERLAQRPIEIGDSTSRKAVYETIVRNPVPLVDPDGRTFRNGDICGRAVHADYECIGKVSPGDSGADLVRLLSPPNDYFFYDVLPACPSGIVYLQSAEDSERDRRHTTLKSEGDARRAEDDEAIRQLMTARGLLQAVPQP